VKDHFDDLRGEITDEICKSIAGDADRGHRVEIPRRSLGNRAHQGPPVAGAFQDHLPFHPFQSL
jgi:hypothetical protein